MIDTITQLNELSTMAPAVKAVRIAVKGGTFVKREGYLYLPHPSQIDQNTKEAQVRYSMYLAGADFSEIPGQTLTTILGKLAVEKLDFEPPEKLNYLIDNVDGDGLSFDGLAKSCASNILQVKWHVLVTDYRGLSDVDTQSVSIADIQGADLRANIKQYNRESVFDYGYKRIGGVLQLSYLLLRELSKSSKKSVGVNLEDDIETFLLLALDDEGNYYQQKVVKAEKGYVESERNYVTVAGAPLKWLPVEIASDEELPAGELPDELGYLEAITNLAYSRYRVSADYKEAIRNLPPTTYISGMTVNKHEQFTETNGRDYVATGAGSVNFLPEDVTVKIEGANTQLEGYERFFKDNATSVRAQGGSFEDDNNSQKTATGANIDSFNQTAKLGGLASSLEEALRRSVLYCGMFEGLYGQDNIEDNIDQIQLKLPRDFATAKLTPEEGLMYLNFKQSGDISRAEFLRIIVQGGLTVQDAETIEEELSLQPPAILT